MVRPLTKKMKTGDIYAHPAEVLKNIEGTAGQSLETLTHRARDADRKSPQYLRSECLVHLVREAIRRDDEAMYNAMLPILLQRCELRLRAKIPDSVPQAEQLREEVLGELGVLFAQDAASDGSTELDFYECKFEKAFKSLRYDVLSKEANKPIRAVSLMDGSTGLDDGESEGSENEPNIPATQHQELDWEEILDLLPPDERKAFVLCKLMGYEFESPKPGKVTAAMLCGVSGRTVRSLVKNAREKLKRAIQGDT